MYRSICALFLVTSWASAATIVSGTFSSHTYQANFGPTNSLFQNFITSDFTITFSGSLTEQGSPFPVSCSPTNIFANPCTIAAGSPFSATYTNLTYGLSLLYNGTTYLYSPAGIQAPWQLTLTYTPTSNVLYGPPGSVASGLYDVTGSFTAGDPSGVGYLIHNDPLTGAALASIGLNLGPDPGGPDIAVVAIVNFVSAPEPAAIGLVGAGLAAALFARRQRATK
jgi:hypothetical protein